MADKKESALGAVTDFAQTRVLDASGASKNIDKATMASVLAGVLSKGTLNVDADAIFETGFYSISGQGSVHNIPIEYGHFLCIKTGGYYSHIQICLPRGSVSESALYYRSYNPNDSSWNNWQKIPTPSV